MFISASGNVGIGTLTPIQKLEVSGRGHFGGVDTPYIDFKTTDTTGVGWQFKQMSFKDATNNELYAIGYVYPNLKFDVAGSRVMTLTNGGNILIQPSATLGINTSDGSDNSYLTLSAADSAGDTRGARIYLSGNERAVDAGNVVIAAGNSTSGTGAPGTIVFRTGADSEKMRISANGNIGAPNGSNIYNASDLRLKQNITAITEGLDKIIALNPVKFNWIDGFEPSEDGKNMLGFVAQELQNVIPEAVENFGNSSIVVGETTVENPLRVNEKFIIPVLVKAIQELKAEFDEYKTTHP
jgi:hypothetical protein